jgi:hypothetical protein
VPIIKWCFILTFCWLGWQLVVGCVWDPMARTLAMVLYIREESKGYKHVNM